MSDTRYIDLFAGVGGFRYGIERAFNSRPNLRNGDSIVSNNSTNTTKSQIRATCVYSNEWDKYANSVYRKHYGECDIRDIREVKSEEIPDHDLLVGGFPCQAFSIAGKRRGFDETRGTLFFEIARILAVKQPRLLLLENVKGLLSHDKGRTFEIILATLDELGYDLQWQVLNSKDFGVPQNRERVFIVGHLRGTSRPQVFPIAATNRQDWLGSDAVAWSKSHRTGKAPEDYKRKNRGKTELRYKTGELNTLSAGDGGGNQSTQNFVTTPTIRRLTPIECERLQGFPDNWTKYDADSKEVSDTQRYKMMGNAVTTNVVSAIIEKLLKGQSATH